MTPRIVLQPSLFSLLKSSSRGSPLSTRTSVGIFALLWCITVAHGTPTGLNNIPTADLVPDRTVAVQVFDNLGAGEHDFWTGFKTGLDLPWFNLEWGLDSHLAPGAAGPLYFQTKVGFVPWENGKIAVGVASVALTDHDDAAGPFSYAVLSQDFGLARCHVGYGLQDHGNTVLLGVDRTVKLWERNINLNADLVQIHDGEGWMPAVGLKYDLSKHFVFETWANLPDEGSASFMLKLNYVFTY